ncbi:MAG: ABC transporter permease [Caldilineaceae bacterium]|nr:ABC transporter permease [Caldilineaceae bacterium]MCB0140051.1 ABC transporter permease [Caldilineaceae bacterium]
MSIRYVLGRLLFFFVVVWAGITLIFFLPRLAPGRDPVRERLGMMAAMGGMNAENVERLAQAYEAKFGLDLPLWKQYLNYMSDIARFNLGYSLAKFPTRVIDIIGPALPWTISLLTVATVMAFLLGSLLGGLIAWDGAPPILRFLLPPLFTFSAIPYYLLGLILIYLFAFKLKWFPLTGGSQILTMPSVSFSYLLELIYHSILPALSIVLASIGFWALSMRGMMITVEGEDYVTLAEAKGLPSGRVFLWYAMRNALLPQTTALALSLGTILSGSLLVEIMFGYPGIGSALFIAITGFDYFVIYGIVFMIVVTIALATLILDLIYPLLDPRIRYQES